MKIKCLTFAALLSFPFLAQAQNGVNVSAKVFLQGALTGVPEGDGLMRDDLREKQLLPTEEPYSEHPSFDHISPGGGETVAGPAVFQATGNDAIVDWVFLELRDPEETDLVLHTRSALLQRDGDVVDVDGVSPVFFEGVETGEYYLAVYHRNHLGAMSKHPLQLGPASTAFDFTQPGTEIYGDHAQVFYDGKNALWAGDVNKDGRVIWQGPGTDAFQICTTVISDPENEHGVVNFVGRGYSSGDVNMDGETIYAGPGSDKLVLGFHVWAKASLLWCPELDNCVVLEAIP